MDLQKEAAILEQKPDDATEKGKKIGRDEGIQIGHQKGKAEGKKQAKIAMAKNSLKAGASIEVIVEITSFSVDDIKNPKGELPKMVSLIVQGFF